MIVWSGWGILVVAIAVLVGGPVAALSTAVLTAAGLERFAGAGVAFGALAAAAANWWAGRRLNGSAGRILVDPATGQQVVLRRSHTLFFMPMQWWSVPMALLGVVALLASLFNSAPLTDRRPGPGAGQARSL